MLIYPSDDRVTAAVVIGFIIIAFGIALIIRDVNKPETALSRSGARTVLTGIFMLAICNLLGPVQTSNFAIRGIIQAELVTGIVSGLFWVFSGRVVSSSVTNLTLNDTENMRSLNASAGLLASIALVLGGAASMLPQAKPGYGHYSGAYCILAFIMLILGLPSISASLLVTIRHFRTLSVKRVWHIQLLTIAERTAYALLFMLLFLMISGGWKHGR